MRGMSIFQASCCRRHPTLFHCSRGTRMMKGTPYALTMAWEAKGIIVNTSELEPRKHPWQMAVVYQITLHCWSSSRMPARTWIQQGLPGAARVHWMAWNQVGRVLVLWKLGLLLNLHKGDGFRAGAEWVLILAGLVHSILMKHSTADGERCQPWWGIARVLKEYLRQGIVWPSWMPWMEIWEGITGIHDPLRCYLCLWFGVPILRWQLCWAAPESLGDVLRELAVALGLRLDCDNGGFVISDELEMGMRCVRRIVRKARGERWGTWRWRAGVIQEGDPHLLLANEVRKKKI